VTVTVGLAWHSLRPGNLGIDALSRTDIAIINSAAQSVGVDVDYVLMGNPARDNGPPDIPGVTVGPRPSLKRLLIGKDKYRAAVRRCDIVIDIGEGDSFADIYGAKRFGVQIISKLFALLAGKPLVLAPQTIGPFKHPASRAIAVYIMKRCEQVFSRDKLSTQVLRDLGITSNAAEAIDLAFSLPFTTPTRSIEGSTRVGINVSGLLAAGGYNSGNQFGLKIDYLDFTRSIIEHFLAIKNVEVFLVPHVLSAGSIEDDVAASKRLQDIYPRLKLAPSFQDSAEAKSFISGLDFLVAARMHACIAAFSSGVAVVPVAYSRKFAGLFGTLGFDYVLDAQKLGTEDAVAFVKKAFIERSELENSIKAGLEIVHERLKSYEDFIAKLLKRIASKKI